ncbi:P1 family peptidase [Desulfomonile tiedjei]|uniref:L-aminopeptidase/D-esterase n=1 Tax=Desulfomonile tiedjei (strain ATCC 49306 / DSM 6799 / DCB-1) TaxID=706587 RepID=I4C6Z0_DESTA|nr:P1 family peptidase [Desulfomonile tiedjei]AFM25331.1 L-aminopeptidase/D-esterase [Desulfomonile tiedjei DSM 6799]
MGKTGKENYLTDVQGILIGHFTSLESASGVTVVLCPKGATAGVDVRGAAPGTRETDLLAPLNLVEQVQAVVLSGGSVYGLSASDGVVRWLSEQGMGFPLPDRKAVPIVPAAVLFDLGRGKDFVPPVGPEWGRIACENAVSKYNGLGCLGAGTGAVSGAIKGGLGSASEVLASGITVAAIVAVNSLGSVIDSRTGLAWELETEIDDEFGPIARRRVKLPQPEPPAAAANTTIGLIATDAVLTKAQAMKIAQMAHDGLARAIRPCHTMFDGDTIFCVATGIHDLPDTPGFFVAPKAVALNDIGRSAADCMSRAIIRGIVETHSLGTAVALRDLEAF